ncbi:hypothetical protein MMSYN1_0926 [synthetic Mycoplasma mycoides JCVI-syn1.0]|nr:hypothetical protein MMSYN1_0926 [synthetic Mycoplasma mycoides JCVI-syn1.0]
MNELSRNEHSGICFTGTKLSPTNEPGIKLSTGISTIISRSTRMKICTRNGDAIVSQLVKCINLCNGRISPTEIASRESKQPISIDETSISLKTANVVMCSISSTGISRTIDVVVIVLQRMKISLRSTVIASLFSYVAKISLIMKPTIYAKRTKLSLRSTISNVVCFTMKTVVSLIAGSSICFMLPVVS